MDLLVNLLVIKFHIIMQGQVFDHLIHNSINLSCPLRFVKHEEEKLQVSRALKHILLLEPTKLPVKCAMSRTYDPRASYLDLQNAM